MLQRVLLDESRLDLKGSFITHFVGLELHNVGVVLRKCRALFHNAGKNVMGLHICDYCIVSLLHSRLCTPAARRVCKIVPQNIRAGPECLRGMPAIAENYLPDKELRGGIVVAVLMTRIAVILHQPHVLRNIAVRTAERIPIGSSISLELVREIESIVFGEAVLRVPCAGGRTLHRLRRLDTERPIIPQRGNKAA